MRTSLLHWNVFEDGLAATPSAIGLEPDLCTSLNNLLKALNPPGPNQLHAIAATRDLAAPLLPLPLDSAAALLGFLDLVYTGVYHACGGNDAKLVPDPLHELPLLLAEREELDLAAAVPLGGALRSLFLDSVYANDGAWDTPAFERELGRATRLLAKPAAISASQAARAVRDTVFDARTGTLTWPRSVTRRIVKRETLFACKLEGLDEFGKRVARGLGPVLFPRLAPATSEMAGAMDLLVRVTREPLVGEPRALIEAQLGEAGELLVLRTLTLQASILLLLRQLFEGCAAEDASVWSAARSFCGEPSPGASAAGASAPSADAMAKAVATRLQEAIKAWVEVSTLEVRHRAVRERIALAAPELLTLVEYDAAWRALPLTPPGRSYGFRAGLGTASVAYDESVFEPADALSETLRLPRHVRSNREAGSAAAAAGGGSAASQRAAPKNSAVALLRHKSSGRLFVVVAVHLESGPPSDSAKVSFRSHQMRALLRECNYMAEQIRKANERAVVVVAGDFNALREEFVHGNAEPFYEARRPRGVVPPLVRPEKPRAPPPEPPFARIGPRGDLRLACGALDKGELVEIFDDADADARCTRSGSTMGIDFVLLGHVGFGGDNAGGDGREVETAEGSEGHRRLRVVRGTARDVVSASERSAASASSSFAVRTLGSDHLPVSVSLDDEY